jgi:hypothetical protein
MLFALSTEGYMFADTKDSSSSHFVTKYARLFLANGELRYSIEDVAGNESITLSIPSTNRHLVDMLFYYHVSRLLLVPMALGLLAPGLLYILRTRKVLPDLFKDVMEILAYGYNEMRRCHLIGNNLDLLQSIYSVLKSNYNISGFF